MAHPAYDPYEPAFVSSRALCLRFRSIHPYPYQGVGVFWRAGNQQDNKSGYQRQSGYTDIEIIKARPNDRRGGICITDLRSKSLQVVRFELD